MEVRWKVRTLDDRPNSLLGCPSLTLSHPLQARSLYYNKAARPEVAAEEPKYEFVDPLGATIDDEITSISSRIDRDVSIAESTSERRSPALDNTLETKPLDRMVFDIVLPDFEPWRTKRKQILETFSTSEKLTISSSFLPAQNGKGVTMDKTKRRLAVLEDLSGLRKLSEISQTEFVGHVNELRELLIVAWNNNKRVEAVRLVTELARMLSSTSNPSFYPSQWVLVTDIIDLFGKLVYDRLEMKSNEERRSLHQNPLSANFSSNDVPPNAMETAKNWFCKIADIKELVPRLYVETALIPCLRFLDSSTIHVNLLRLSTMAAKLPHILLAAYARAYVSKVSMWLCPVDRAPHWKAINDWMQGTVNIMPELTWPAFEWLIQCVSYQSTTVDDIGPLWSYCKQSSTRAYVLRSFLNGVSPRYIALHALDIVPLVTADGGSALDMAVFGDRLLLTDTPEGIRPQILRSIWKAISNLPTVREYLKCCLTWTRFASKYFSVNEVTFILGHLTKRLSTDKNLEFHLPSLVTIIHNVFELRNVGLTELLRHDTVSTLLDWLRDEPYASQSARCILTSLVKSQKTDSIDDLTVAIQVIEQARRFCGSLKPDTMQDEVRSVCHLICSSLDLLSLSSSDPERAVTLLVEARATLGQWPIITSHIVHSMISFGLRSSDSLPDSAKKANFMRACVANLFITIPSIEDPVLQFQCAIQTLYISILANSLPQSDALLRFAVERLDSMSASPLLLTLSSQWLSVLLSVPDSPSKPMLYMFNAFVNVVERKSWPDPSLQAEFWAVSLRYLWAVGQPEIPGKFKFAAGNDTLYGSNSDYLEAVEEKTSYVMDKMMELVDTEDAGRPLAAILLLEHVSCRMEIEGPICRLVSNLLKRCVRSEAFPVRVEYVIDELRIRGEENGELDTVLRKLNL